MRLALAISQELVSTKQNQAKPNKQSDGRRNKLRLLHVKICRNVLLKSKKKNKFCFYLDVHILVRTLNELTAAANQMSIVVSPQLPRFSLSDGEST